MDTEKIISLLPYEEPFLFVEGIDEVSEDGITGYYTFKSDEYFYRGHFRNNPVTPGVILTECMAQVGLVCLGIYLLREELSEGFKPQIALTSHQIDFYIPVFPGERVTVVSEKEMFRFNKLKCSVKLYNENNDLVARGHISGMLKASDE